MLRKLAVLHHSNRRLFSHHHAYYTHTVVIYILNRALLRSQLRHRKSKTIKNEYLQP